MGGVRSRPGPGAPAGADCPAGDVTPGALSCRLVAAAPRARLPPPPPAPGRAPCAPGAAPQRAHQEVVSTPLPARPGAWTVLPSPPHSTPFRRRRSFREPQPHWAVSTARKLRRREGRASGRTGAPGAVGDPRGPGSPPFSLTSLRRRGFGESWAPSGCVATCTGRVGVCPRAWKL